MTYEHAIRELAEAAQEMLDAHEEHKPCILCSSADEARLLGLRAKWRERRRQSRSWMQEALLNYEAAVRMREAG